jgi:hypothetical protein
VAREGSEVNDDGEADRRHAQVISLEKARAREKRREQLEELRDCADDLQLAALDWLEKMVHDRGGPVLLSRELGFGDDWAGRILSGRMRCNWSFSTLDGIAAALCVDPRGRIIDLIRSAEVVPSSPSREEGFSY